LTSKEKVDRLAIIVSGEGALKLLGVPAMSSGTGKAQSEAVMAALKDWKLEHKIQGMSFYTSSYTGRENGGCVFLERSLERERAT
jgi:hypothetical protein